MNEKKFIWPTFLILGLVLFGCSQLTYKPVPMQFEIAVRTMADHLLRQVSKQRGMWSSMDAASFVVDPVIDADTGEVTETSLRIQEIMVAEAHRTFPKFAILEMNSENIGNASYVTSGVMQSEPYGGDTVKLPHILMSIVDRKTGQIIAHSDAWIANSKLEFKPTAMYKDSPMYLKDKRMEAHIATARAPVGRMAEKEYFSSMDTSALLEEAIKAYNQNDHKRALKLFSEAATRSDGQVMKTYSGLYQSSFRLGNRDLAEEEFSKLANLAVEYGEISVKFLFKVNSTEFFGDQDELDEYQIWLRQLSKRILDSKICMHIIGHSSHTGNDCYNIKLSYRRAKSIQERLKDKSTDRVQTKELSKRTEPLGRGFHENIKGTGTDDEKDAIDRRVVFKLEECPLPQVTEPACRP